MTEKIDLDRVREINPVREAPDDPEAAERLLRRVLAQPRRPPRRGRRVTFRVAAVATSMAVAAAAAVALWPSSGGSSNVIANAAAALSQPDTILHFKARVASGPRLRRVTWTDESWYADGGRRQRTVRQHRSDVSELVSDHAARTNLVYSSKSNEIIRYSQSHPWEVEEPALDDLARLFARARDGARNVHLLGETTVRGVSVYKVRIDETYTVRERVGDKLKPKRRTFSREVYLDRERFLPVRIVHRVDKHPFGFTDFIESERIPLTPESERLLRMAPHPGARVIDR